MKKHKLILILLTIAIMHTSGVSEVFPLSPSQKDSLRPQAKADREVQEKIQGINDTMPVWYFIKAFGVDPQRATVEPLDGPWGRVRLAQHSILGLEGEGLRKAVYQSLQEVMGSYHVYEHLGRKDQIGSLAELNNAYLLTYQKHPVALVWPGLGKDSVVVTYDLYTQPQNILYGKSTEQIAFPAQEQLIRLLISRHSVQWSDIHEATKALWGAPVGAALVQGDEYGVWFPTVYPPSEKSTRTTRGKLRRLQSDGVINLAGLEAAEIGSGSGVNAVLLLELGAKRVHAMDISLLKLMNTEYQLNANRNRHRPYSLYLNTCPSADFYIFNSPTYRDEVNKDARARFLAEDSNLDICAADLRKIFKNAAQKAKPGARFLMRIFYTQYYEAGLRSLLEGSGWKIESWENIVQDPRAPETRKEATILLSLRKNNAVPSVAAKERSVIGKEEKAMLNRRFAFTPTPDGRERAMVKIMDTMAHFFGKFKSPAIEIKLDTYVKNRLSKMYVVDMGDQSKGDSWWENGYMLALTEVFYNCLDSTAIRAHLERQNKNYKGKVSINIARRGNDLVLEISDNGIGIERSVLGRLFKKIIKTSEKKIHREPLQLATGTGGEGILKYYGRKWISESGGKIEIDTLHPVSGAYRLIYKSDSDIAVEKSAKKTQGTAIRFTIPVNWDVFAPGLVRRTLFQEKSTNMTPIMVDGRPIVEILRELQGLGYYWTEEIAPAAGTYSTIISKGGVRVGRIMITRRPSINRQEPDILVISDIDPRLPEKHYYGRALLTWMLIKDNRWAGLQLSTYTGSSSARKTYEGMADLFSIKITRYRDKSVLVKGVVPCLLQPVGAPIRPVSKPDREDLCLSQV